MMSVQGSFYDLLSKKVFGRKPPNELNDVFICDNNTHFRRQKSDVSAVYYTM